MGLKKCEKCGEMADEAKAFCPGCGNPFIAEEVRQGSSEFDKYAGTVNITKSVYGMMLTEMELDTSRKPEAEAPADVPEVADVESPPETAPENLVRLLLVLLVGAVVLIPLAAALIYYFFT